MSVLISEEGQHDDHCRMTFFGRNWYIDRIDGIVFTLRNEDGVVLMDASQMRWGEYCATASEWLREAA